MVKYLDLTTSNLFMSHSQPENKNESDFSQLRPITRSFESLPTKGMEHLKSDQAKKERARIGQFFEIGETDFSELRPTLAKVHIPKEKVVVNIEKIEHMILFISSKSPKDQKKLLKDLKWYLRQGSRDFWMRDKDFEKDPKSREQWTLLHENYRTWEYLEIEALIKELARLLHKSPTS